MGIPGVVATGESGGGVIIGRLEQLSNVGASSATTSSRRLRNATVMLILTTFPFRRLGLTVIVVHQSGPAKASPTVLAGRSRKIPPWLTEAGHPQLVLVLLPKVIANWAIAKHRSNEGR